MRTCSRTMSIRVIHTGDIHLGQTLCRHPRLPEHQRFFSWLRDELIATRANALVIAGDLFHHTNPTAGSLSVFFDFLGSLAAPQLSALRDIVVVAGNHDGAARLPPPVLLSPHSKQDPSSAPPTSRANKSKDNDNKYSGQSPLH